MYIKAKVAGRSSVFSKPELKICGDLWPSYNKKTSKLVKELKEGYEKGWSILENIVLNQSAELREIGGAFCFSLQNEDTVFIYKSLLFKKSVYYRLFGKELLWSIEPHDLILKEDMSGLKLIKKEFLLLSCMGESPLPNQSFYTNISRLPAGHLLIFSKNELAIKKIDFLDRCEPLKKARLLDYAEEARRLIDRSIRYQMEDKNNVGVLLSGGVDSSVILCSLKNMEFNVRAYHWSFKGIPAADESFYANAVSNKHKIKLRNIESDDIIRTASYINADWLFQTPYNHSFYRMFEKTKQACMADGVEYLANGYLGDVLFGPNQDVTFKSLIRSLPFHEVPKYLKESIGTVWFSKRNEAKDGTHPMLQRLPWYQNFLSDDAIEIVKDAHAFIPLASSFEEELIRCSDNETDSALELGLFYDDVHLMYPLSTRELLEFSLQLPLGYRMIPTGSQWVDKPVLRLAYQDLLPKEIISRNHRQSLDAMEEVYVYKNASQIYDFLKNSMLVTLKLIDTDKLKSVFNDRSKLTSSASGLICCIMTELWLNKVTHNEAKENNSNVSDKYFYKVF
ncbi:hypothetical protein G8C92_10315 [Paenibacillus donghaensis]|uniref:asparagine synthase-related protein n=1 Tax=Paenibacillus donghaensis TaxID=414771 RepID=UPI001883E125|nr:asparagine synthase C-terminal domain-containing protein [Paenibacillus donghaensis]MBE9914425.1 hypothetical protein [Paenibacillus donghaensis]